MSQTSTGISADRQDKGWRLLSSWGLSALFALVTGLVSCVVEYFVHSGRLILSFTAIATATAGTALYFRHIYGSRLEEYQIELAQRSEEIVQKSLDMDRMAVEAEETNSIMQQMSYHFDELFRKIPAPCFCFDAEGRFKEWNRAFEDLTLLDPGRIINAAVSDFITIESDAIKMQSLVQSVFNGETFESIELQTANATGGIKTILCNAFPLRGEGGKVTAAICAGVDITERIRLENRMLKHVELLSVAQLQLEEQHQELLSANEKLESLAMSDSLTGLKNHRALQERLTAEFRRSMRYGSPVSLLLIDVDRFKKYNDSYGHLAGDAVLREVADVLTKCMRDTDFVARYGGEEFVVVLPHSDYMGSLEAADRLRSAIEQAPWELIRVTVSIGVSTIKTTMSHHSDLIGNADRALYFCKQHGRNQVLHADDLPATIEIPKSSKADTTVDLDDRSSFAV